MQSPLFGQEGAPHRDVSYMFKERTVRLNQLSGIVPLVLMLPFTCLGQTIHGEARLRGQRREKIESKGKGRATVSVTNGHTCRCSLSLVCVSVPVYEVCGRGAKRWPDARQAGQWQHVHRI